MERNIVFRAARCLACSMPTGRRGLLLAAQQAASLLKPFSVFSAARTQLPPPSASSFHTLHKQAASGAVGNKSLLHTNISSPLTGPGPSPLLPVSIPSITVSRGRAKIYYQPSAWKRVNKHGMEKRLLSPGGIEVLWRRVLKKRHSLTPFDRILPGTYKGQILPAHHLKMNKQLTSREVRRKMNEALGKK